MSLTYLIEILLIGLIAGWLAGKVMRGRGYGVLIDIVVGIIGSFLGGFVFGILGIYAGSLIGRIIVAFIGAVILIWIVRKLGRR
jgi:uncharacterized membrane protein YeaQ/YmgE (transglycosylase-associated protein family)